MASLFSELWPGILGAVMTGLLIYLSLRHMTHSRSYLAALKWRAELSETAAHEAAATSPRRGG